MLFDVFARAVKPCSSPDQSATRIVRRGFKPEAKIIRAASIATATAGAVVGCARRKNATNRDARRASRFRLSISGPFPEFRQSCCSPSDLRRDTALEYQPSFAALTPRFIILHKSVVIFGRHRHLRNDFRFGFFSLRLQKIAEIKSSLISVGTSCSDARALHEKRSAASVADCCQ